nr:hypothetical protein [Lachnospiraceae bacterium]
MDVNKLQNVSAYQQSSRMSNETASSAVAAQDKTKDQSSKKVLLENSAGVLVEGTPAAVYEKSDIVTMLKNDAKARVEQMQNMVADALHKQANISASGDDVWKFLASGNFSVTEAAKTKAQELISEDGYYGVEQTSQRILDFAKALSGNDVSKAEELLDAFKDGFKQATKSWGKDLPDICQDTYKAVEKKFDQWVNE